MVSVSKSVALIVAAFIGCAAGFPAQAASQSVSHAATHATRLALAPPSNHAPITGRTSTPYGWVDFCQRYKGECDGKPMEAADVNLTPETMKIIRQVNTWVNTNIKPMSDMDHWCVVDQWDYTTDGFGDCED